MNARTILLLTIGGALASCATPPPSPEELAAAKAMPAPASQADAENAAREYFNDVLKDPSSAVYKFRQPISGIVRAYDHTYRGWFMCGDVNAKNSYGGYTGFSRFVVQFDQFTGMKVVEDFADSGNDRLAARMCKELYGY